jgi:hypothetical protein
MEVASEDVSPLDQGQSKMDDPNLRPPFMEEGKPVRRRDVTGFVNLVVGTK